MTRITYRTVNHGDITVDVADGVSLMAGAVGNLVPGIDAECGGVCSCATCRVEIPAEWASRVTPMGADEKSMLEFTIDPTERSRLSCQITIAPELDGIVVEVPVTQR